MSLSVAQSTSAATSPAGSSSTPEYELELSVVMPCLNEHETVGICVEKAVRALREQQINGEVIVADNGSTDGSIEIATQLGARVVHVTRKGYGSALMGGIEAARGKYVLMGDADDSYDFLELTKFLVPLRAGNELVQGCRLPWGGGTVAVGAMPWLHYWLGNPMFSVMSRFMFRAPIHDVYCGLRGFTRALYDRLNMRCTGMEFATEMIIKASLFGERIAEVPITLHPDGRKTRRPHLRTFRDGWRTLRFFLMYSPRWLYMVPGVLLMLFGILGYILALPHIKVFGVTFDAHTLLVSSLAFLMGVQTLSFAVFAKTFAVNEGLQPPDRFFNGFFKIFNLERGLLFGISSLMFGLLLLIWAVDQWRQANFGPLDYAQTMRLVVPGVTLVAGGYQLMLASFLTSILGMSRK